MGFFKNLLILAVLVVGGVWFYGRSLPREHRVVSTVTLVAPVDTVYSVIRNVGSSYLWWSDVKAVRRLELRRESYEQNMGAAGMVSVEITSADPPRRVVMTILNLSQENFGGRSVYDVRLTTAGTEVTVTEEGWIDPPFYRVIAKVRGLHRTQTSFLASLGAHFGETVTPRRAR